MAQQVHRLGELNKSTVNAVLELRSSAGHPNGVCLSILVPLLCGVSQHHRGVGEQHPHLMCSNWSVLCWQRKGRHNLWRNLGNCFFCEWGKGFFLLLLEKSGSAFLLFSFTSLTWFSKIFNQELFGNLAEEKEVKGIVSKVMEARKNKSYDSYEILGKFIGKGQMTKLILPLKEVREKSARVFLNCWCSQFCMV